jgi:hypothetical protein
MMSEIAQTPIFPLAIFGESYCVGMLT